VAAKPWGQQVAIGTASLALALGLLVAIQVLARPLALLLAAIVIAQALGPAVAWLERWLPRIGAILFVYLVLVGALGVAGWLMVPQLVAQATEVLTNVPGLVDRAQSLIDRWDPTPRNGALRVIERWVSDAASTLISLPFALISSALEIIIVLVMSVYWLIAAPALCRFTLSLFPTTRRQQADRVLREVGQTMGGYVRASVLDAFLVGVVVYAGLLIIGVDYALILALVAALGEFIPMLGPFIAAGPALAVALLTSPVQALVVLVFYVVVQQLESNVLLPQVMRQQADIPPVLAVFALLAGGSVGGILGALIAIPLAGAVRVLVVRAVAPAVRGWVGVD
jgi:predicted PurR-regulated permease PerM